jgi:hypothetical protein
LSPCHGDLNAHNILIWLNRPNHPFLIDFPFYQAEGHAMQDLARLEVEILLAIMDRQDVPGSPPALDHTYSQLASWCELANALVSTPNPMPPNTVPWISAPWRVNLDACLELVRIVREKAVQIQAQQPSTNPPTFFDEYLPALLYHTLKAIAYPSLSIFKRLLAVYSASRILEKLHL